MKIVIPGGSGQVGTLLARAFVANGHDVVVLSRKAGSAPWRVIRWDAQTVGGWAAEIDGADVVINLAGRNVNCRYNSKNRRLIMESRTSSVRAVGQAIARAVRPPRVWLQASTATIYAHRLDAPNDEATGILGGAETSAPEPWRFSTEVAKAWEKATAEAIVPRTRKVVLLLGHDHESRSRRDLRCVTGIGPLGPRWGERGRPPVCLVDPRTRLRQCDYLDY